MREIKEDFIEAASDFSRKSFYWLLALSIQHKILIKSLNFIV